MGVGDHLRDGQPEAGACTLALGRFRPVEAFENMRERRGGDAGPRILNRNGDFFGAAGS